MKLQVLLESDVEHRNQQYQRRTILNLVAVGYICLLARTTDRNDDNRSLKNPHWAALTSE